jgi:O-antigen ligase
LFAAVSLVGLGAATGGLVFSGSRGPWISALVAVPLVLLVAALARPSARRPALVLAVLGLAGIAGTWIVAGDFVVNRVDQALADVRDAAAGDYGSDVGTRLDRWAAAWSVFVEHPIGGAGGGGYATAIVELGYEAPMASDHHAHSFYMHELATAGAAGALLLLAVIVLTVRGVIRIRPDHPYALGTLFALIGWLVGAQFDCYQLTGTMFGLFTFITALALPPLVARRRTAPPDPNHS